MEQYYEQNVVNNNIDERIKKTKTLSIAKTACLVIALAALFTIILFITDDNFLIWLAILCVVSVPFVIAAVIIGMINKRNNIEYDYILDDEKLKVCAIYFRTRRKLKYTVPVHAIESVGVFNSEGYKRIQESAVKKDIALVNYDDEDVILYILYRTEKGKRILFIEPDRGFMIALRRVVSAVMIFDKSVSSLEKKLNEEIVSDDIS